MIEMVEEKRIIFRLRDEGTIETEMVVIKCKMDDRMNQEQEYGTIYAACVLFMLLKTFLFGFLYLFLMRLFLTLAGRKKGFVEVISARP